VEVLGEQCYRNFRLRGALAMTTLMAFLLVAVSSGAAPGDATSQVETSAVDRSNAEFILKNYPERALKAGEEGKVFFRATIAPEGYVSSCEITKSSGFKSLDSETCELILVNARFRPVYNSEGRAVVAVHDGFVNWKLPAEARAKASAQPKALAASDKQDKIVCQRVARTGSLVAKTRQCLTSNEWMRQARQTRDAAERITGGGAFWAGKTD
jgi:TonB family protein